MAILIDIDMPESCLLCIFHDSPEFDVFCDLTNKYVANWNDAEGVKPDWCPLREVVRCKDCKRYESDGGALMICTLNDMIADDDCFCWWGERKEE